MANRFDLVYGPALSGKTTWWMRLAEELFAKKGLKTRAYIGDQSITTIDEAGLLEDGVVEAWYYGDHSHPTSVIDLITKGYWPKDLNDPNGHLTPGNPEGIGMIVFEGITMMAEYVMGSVEGGLQWRAARGEKIAQDSAYVVNEPSLTGNPKDVRLYGSNNMAHYMYAQNRLADAIRQSKSLPVPIVYWTAHEASGEDKEQGNEKIIGPAGAGRAMTPKIPRLFGNTTHLTTATKRVKQKDLQTGKEVDVLVVEKRAYVTEHTDPDGLTAVRYIAGNRCPLVPNKEGVLVNPMPSFLAPPDPIKFYQLMADARAARREKKIA